MKKYVISASFIILSFGNCNATDRSCHDLDMNCNPALAIVYADFMQSLSVVSHPLVHFKFTNGSLENSGSLVFGVPLNTSAVAPTMTTGKDGDANGAYLYNGTQFFGTPSDTGLPMGANPRTMCAWVNPAVLPANGTHLMAIRYGSTLIGAHSSALGISQYLNAQKISFVGNFYDVYVDYIMPLNTWSHLCAAFNGGTTASLYVNGSLVADQAFAGTATPPLNTTSESFVIGTWGGTQNWQGVLDDVRIYDTALTPMQIGLVMKGSAQ